MNYLQLSEIFKNYVIFSNKDIFKFDKKFDSRRLYEWQNKGYIQKLRNNYYRFNNHNLDENTLFIISNKVYNPSYISFESALRYYNLIPESVYQITATTSRKTMEFISNQTTYIYHHIKPTLFFGYCLRKSNDNFFTIATPEKALLDYLYINSHLDNRTAIEELRLNREELTKLDWGKIDNYLKVFSKKNLAQKINHIKEGIK